MTRKWYVVVVVLAVIGGAALVILYKTPPVPTMEQPEAEFGGVSLRIEFATTTTSMELGLGGRAHIADDYGMLFVFPKDDRYGIWMKDMRFPIDIFWLDAQGHVVSIAQRVATSSYPNVFYPPVPVRYVLETASGFAQVHAIATGTPLLLKNLPIVSE